VAVHQHTHKHTYINTQTHIHTHTHTHTHTHVHTEVSDEDDNCRLDEYGLETAERLRQVFRSVDKNGDGTITKTEIAECFQAVGIKEELALTSSSRLVSKFSVSASGDLEVSAVPTEDITEEQFFNMYGELVREQDSASPVGTFAFMAPEQLLQANECNLKLGNPSPLTDIYSLGVTLFSLASDRLPQEPAAMPKASIEEQKLAWTNLMARDFDQPLAGLRSVQKNMPEQLERIISKAVNKQPLQRYADIFEMEEELSELSKILKSNPST